MPEEIKTEATTAQTTAVTVTLWAKLKTLFTRIKTSVVAFFTTTAAWLKAQFNARPWVKYAAIVVIILSLAGGIGYWRDRQLVSQIDTLKTENQAKTEQIKAVEAERDDIRAQYNELKAKLIKMQSANNMKIKEAGKNAYKKVMSLRTADILNYYNTVYRPGVVQRNTVRQRQYSNSD